MRNLIIMALVAMAGCATDDTTEPRVYSCTILYRCVGDANITARLAMPCAGDLDEATDLAMEAGFQAVDEACPDSWQYVRPMCAEYQPATTCEQ